MGEYLAVKGNEGLAPAAVWRNLECLMLSERSKKQRTFLFLLYETSRIGKSRETVSLVSWELAEMTVKGYQRVLESVVVMDAQLLNATELYFSV